MVGTQNWEEFGVRPQRNHNFNLLTSPITAENTPWLEFGQYADYYCLLMATWRQECCFFGINDDGYWCAYMPDNYNWMSWYTFPVGLMYGHPVIRYYGTITPWFKRFIRTNKLVLDEGYDLARNTELMRMQYAIHNLEWTADTENYWRVLFAKLYQEQNVDVPVDYTPGNCLAGETGG